jgi:hypothetical protein
VIGSQVEAGNAAIAEIRDPVVGNADSSTTSRLSVPAFASRAASLVRSVGSGTPNHASDAADPLEELAVSRARSSRAIEEQQNWGKLTMQFTRSVLRNGKWSS